MAEKKVAEKKDEVRITVESWNRANPGDRRWCVVVRIADHFFVRVLREEGEEYLLLEREARELAVKLFAALSVPGKVRVIVENFTGSNKPAIPGARRWSVTVVIDNHYFIRSLKKKSEKNLLPEAEAVELGTKFALALGVQLEYPGEGKETE